MLVEVFNVFVVAFHIVWTDEKAGIYAEFFKNRTEIIVAFSKTVVESESHQRLCGLLVLRYFLYGIFEIDEPYIL